MNVGSWRQSPEWKVAAERVGRSMYNNTRGYQGEKQNKQWNQKLEENKTNSGIRSQKLRKVRQVKKMQKKARKKQHQRGFEPGIKHTQHCYMTYCTSGVITRTYRKRQVAQMAKSFYIISLYVPFLFPTTLTKGSAEWTSEMHHRKYKSWTAKTNDRQQRDKKIVKQ